MENQWKRTLDVSIRLNCPAFLTDEPKNIHVHFRPTGHLMVKEVLEMSTPTFQLKPNERSCSLLLDGFNEGKMVLHVAVVIPNPLTDYRYSYYDTCYLGYQVVEVEPGRRAQHLVVEVNYFRRYTLNSVQRVA